MEQTPNLKLYKWKETDKKLDTISEMAKSMDIIDTQLAEIAINVKSFGAIGNGIANDTQAFVDAVNYAINNGKKRIYVPEGQYSINGDNISLPENFTLYGASEQNSIIRGIKVNNLYNLYTGVGINISGKRVTVKNLTITNFETGIKVNSYYSKIFDCYITYNTVGINYHQLSYITKCKNNEITFNGIGVLVVGESYELIIKDNIIDNNNLGIGLTGSASTGVIISDNTIEGNRNYTTTNGCGILIAGANISRLDIRGNWFESNGSSENSVDIFSLVQGTTTDTTYTTIRDTILSECVPTAYQSLFTVGMAIGSLNIENNGFIFTRYGVFIGMYKATTSIKSNNFKGYLNRNNRHIYLFFTGVLLAARIDIDNNNYFNSDNATIDTQVAAGVRGTIVHSNTPNFADSRKLIWYNGELLFDFTKKMTLNELLTNYETVFVQPFSTTGTKTKKSLLNKRYDGYLMTNNTANDIVLGKTSSADAIFLNKQGQYVIPVGEYGSSWRYNRTVGGWLGWTNQNTVDGKFTIHNLVESTGKAYTENNSIIYAFVFLTAAEYETNFKGITHIQVTDFNTQYVV